MLHQRQADRSASDDWFVDASDAIAFTRELAKAEGTTTPELDAVETGDPEHEYAMAEADVPIERLALRYIRETREFLWNAGWDGPTPGAMLGQPTPLDVLCWYHVLVATRVCRALVSANRADRKRQGALADAQGSAKIALISIERSRAALKQVLCDDNRVAVTHLLEALDTFEHALDARVPGGRTFLRPGLDVSAD
jgi:hypothetical protein